MKDRKRVLVTCPAFQRTLSGYRELFRRYGIKVEAPPVRQQMSESELKRLIGRFDGVIAGDDPFTARVLQEGKRGRLKVLVKWGVGMDAIALDAARRLGIYTSNTPGLFAEEVADTALGYVILLARKLHRIDAAVRRRWWLKIQGTSLRGKTAGIVGFGNVGRQLAGRLFAVGMKVLVTDVRKPAKSLLRKSRATFAGFNTLVRRSDCLILCCSLTPANHHMLNGRIFSKMKRGMWIVNVSRGALIDERALVRALQDKTVRGAALDVFETEPLPAKSPLRSFEEVILGSHNASHTREAVLRANRQAIVNLFRDLGRSSVSRVVDP